MINCEIIKSENNSQFSKSKFNKNNKLDSFAILFFTANRRGKWWTFPVSRPQKNV